MRSVNLSKVVRARLVYHRYLLLAMGVRQRPQIVHVVIRSTNFRVAKTKSMDHRFHFLAMGLR